MCLTRLQRKVKIPPILLEKILILTLKSKRVQMWLRLTQKIRLLVTLSKQSYLIEKLSKTRFKIQSRVQMSNQILQMKDRLHRLSLKVKMRPLSIQLSLRTRNYLKMIKIPDTTKKMRS